jgi:hypothetical protein
MRDIRPIYWLGLPLASLFLCATVALVAPQSYRQYILKPEAGYLEHSTVALLIPAVVFGLTILRRWQELPGWRIRAWAVILTLGALYFAGEECSWGQKYFGWATPETWSRINDQHETNLHNTTGLLDQTPRGLLSAAGLAGIVVPPLLVNWRKRWDPETCPREWLWPTMAVLPAAVIATLLGIPNKFYGEYGVRNAAAPEWLDVMFLGGRHSELKEHFLAMFILMYQWSWAHRLKSFYEGRPAVIGSWSDRNRASHVEQQQRVAA